MNRLLSTLAIAAALALSACGGDDETVTETATDETTAEETIGEESAAEAATGPEGPLAGVGIGPLAVGDDADTVEQAFGTPDEEMRVPGCELSGDTQPKLAWVWHLDQGDLTLQFDAEDRFSSYRTTSPELTTLFGSGVGDSFADLREEYGSALEPLDLGAPSTPKTGFWYIGGDINRVLFSITGGRVDSVSGGSIEICE